MVFDLAKIADDYYKQNPDQEPSYFVNVLLTPMPAPPILVDFLTDARHRFIVFYAEAEINSLRSAWGIPSRLEFANADQLAMQNQRSPERVCQMINVQQVVQKFPRLLARLGIIKGQKGSLGRVCEFLLEGVWPTRAIHTHQVVIGAMTTIAGATLTPPIDPDEPTLLNHLYLANRSVEKKADLNEMRLNARRSKDGRFLVFSDDTQMKFHSRFEELKEMGKLDEEPWYKSLIQFRFFADLFTARNPDTAYQSNEKLANYMGHQK